MRPGPVGAQPRAARVRSLELGASIPAKLANQPKWPAASAGGFETTGMFSRQPIDLGGVEPVHAGPAVKPLADIGGDTLLAGDGDENGEEALVAVAMDRGGEPDGHRPHAAVDESERRLLGFAGEGRGIGQGVRLDRPSPGRQKRHARRYRHRPPRAFERRAQGFDLRTLRHAVEARNGWRRILEECRPLPRGLKSAPRDAPV